MMTAFDSREGGADILHSEAHSLKPRHQGFKKEMIRVAPRRSVVEMFSIHTSILY